MGCIFEGYSEKKIITINYFGERRYFQLLYEFPFTSLRRKMTTIFRDIKKEKIIVFIKGADDTLQKSINAANQFSFQRTIRHVEDFAEKGLRTMLCCYKILDYGKFIQWEENYLKYMKTSDRKENDGENIIYDIEKDVEILGATGIEDQLKEEVIPFFFFL